MHRVGNTVLCTPKEGLKCKFLACVLYHSNFFKSRHDKSWGQLGTPFENNVEQDIKEWATKHYALVVLVSQDHFAHSSRAGGASEGVFYNLFANFSHSSVLTSQNLHSIGIAPPTPPQTAEGSLVHHPSPAPSLSCRASRVPGIFLGELWKALPWAPGECWWETLISICEKLWLAGCWSTCDYFLIILHSKLKKSSRHQDSKT